ncbi:hypothetical protein EDD75_0342 [Thermodesulfitimonas autotrophica]|uniref:Uncharacterized protein n=1 Tax=Thermodesulfitimonas autotrophica TaxID=1894989 RepID=A0A3N5AWC3_9THEO|nr:hypothetical protein [Thermodesulfitimonas autotrophica]RPF49526.1 hypothetical protein EDD75_0342 [Thermodesulfitimonas autotrophica]
MLLAQIRFSRLIEKATIAVAKDDNIPGVLSELKQAAAALQAEKTGGRIIAVKRKVTRKKTRILWALWPEPEGFYARAFLSIFDLVAFTEAPEQFFPEGTNFLDGACVFCGRAEELSSWEFVRQCAVLHEVLGPYVVFWALDPESRRYAPRLLEDVLAPASAVQDPAGRRQILREMGRVVDIRDLRAIRMLTEL